MNENDQTVLEWDGNIPNICIRECKKEKEKVSSWLDLLVYNPYGTVFSRMYCTIIAYYDVENYLTRSRNHHTVSTVHS